MQVEKEFEEELQDEIQVQGDTFVDNGLEDTCSYMKEHLGIDYDNMD